MNCPYCGHEMIKGYIQSARRVLFTAAKSESGIIAKEKGDVVLTANNFTNPAGVAYHCSECRKVIVDYAEESE